MTVQYSASRPAGREHIPLMPKGFIAIRIVQLVLAVLVLALSAFTLSTFPFRANGLSTFVVSTISHLECSLTRSSVQKSCSDLVPEPSR